MKKKFLASTAATAALGLAALLAAAPAAANPAPAPYYGDDIVVGDYTWDLGLNSLRIDDTEYSNVTAGVRSRAWDGGEFAVWDSVNGYTSTVNCPSAVVAAPDADGDVVVTCADESVVGLTASAEIRLYGEGDLARFLVTLSNNESYEIGYNWQHFVRFWDTDSRATSGTPTLGETPYDKSDVWSFNDQTEGFDAGVAWGNDGSSGAHTSVGDQGPNELYIRSAGIVGNQNSLAAGESVTYVFFQKVDSSNTINRLSVASAETGGLTPAAAADPATFMAEFATFDGRLVRGIDPTAVVANWTSASETPAEPEPELAATGASTESVALGVVGALALLLGAGLLAARTMRLRSPSAA